MYVSEIEIDNKKVEIVCYELLYFFFFWVYNMDCNIKYLKILY